MIRIGKKENVYLGIAALAAGMREIWPYRRSLELLKEAGVSWERKKSSGEATSPAP